MQNFLSWYRITCQYKQWFYKSNELHRLSYYHTTKNFCCESLHCWPSMYSSLHTWIRHNTYQYSSDTRPPVHVKTAVHTHRNSDPHISSEATTTSTTVLQVLVQLLVLLVLIILIVLVIPLIPTSPYRSSQYMPVLLVCASLLKGQSRMF